jgi:hypothetical protein
VIFALLVGLVLAGAVSAGLVLAGTLSDDRSLVVVFGWIAPVIAGCIVGGVAYLLLETRSGSSAREESLHLCDSCGAELLEDWRMCPNCGLIVDDETRAKRREYRARPIL